MMGGLAVFLISNRSKCRAIVTGMVSAQALRERGQMPNAIVGEDDRRSSHGFHKV